MHAALLVYLSEYKRGLLGHVKVGALLSAKWMSRCYLIEKYPERGFKWWFIEQIRQFSVFASEMCNFASCFQTVSLLNLFVSFVVFLK